MPALLTELALRARTDSITASSALEGIIVENPARAAKIIEGKAPALRTRSEQELAGEFKSDDNHVVDRSPDGSIEVRFIPMPAAETEFSTAELIDRYQAAVAHGQHHPILLIGLFTLDLLTIHPFADGNGRVARVLTNALLDEADYQVCRFVSLEQVIAESADADHQACVGHAQERRASRRGRHRPGSHLAKDLRDPGRLNPPDPARARSALSS